MAGSFHRRALVRFLALGLVLPAAAQEAPRISFGHVLADFNGALRMGQARVAIDRATGEALVAEGRDVRVFNDVGMQVFGFRTSPRLGAVLDLTATPEGDIITLAVDLEAPGDQPRVAITVHDFRGVPGAEIQIAGMPPGLAGFLPNRVFFSLDRLWFASTTGWLVVVAHPDGTFERALDIAAIIGIPPADRDQQEITGLSVDEAGRILLTCSVQFRAFEISSEGALLGSWGDAGSDPGMFAIVAGIARDPDGRIYVADKNRGVVMVFDAGYRFLMEFGGDPGEGGVLGLPSDVFVGQGKAYVTQIGRRGVWTYDIGQSPKT